ncbi:30S ribosomal protein S1 [Metabacillus fastidiosus]|uniref:30S ribosomal protein S1 n=1 Tax=Metabacillus fastidiosus TaxID=1458 RepID=UPI003D2BE2CC
MQDTHDYEMQKATAWADIRNAARTGEVLYAQAIGLEYIPVAGKKEECLKLNYNGIYGFLPITFIDNYEFKGLQNFIGKVFEFCVTTVDLDGQIFAANRIKALEQLAKRFWRRAKSGEKYTAFVRGVDRFHVYLLVDGVPTRMHRDEYSYTFYEDLREEVFIGESLEVELLEVNKPLSSVESDSEEEIETDDKTREGSISVSRKVLETDPMAYIHEYQEKATYLGTITKVHLDHGLFIRLEPRGIQVRTGFPPGTDQSLLQEGQTVNFKIQEINMQQRRVKGIVITPKQAFQKNRQTRSMNHVR